MRFKAYDKMGRCSALTQRTSHFTPERSTRFRPILVEEREFAGLPLPPQQSNVCARDLRRRLGPWRPEGAHKMESNYATESTGTSDSGKSVSIPGTPVTKHKNKSPVVARPKSETNVRAQNPRSPRAKSD